MTSKYTFEMEFIVPEEIDREDVCRVIDDFADNLVGTDSFVGVSRVSEPMDEPQRHRLCEMLDMADQQAVATSIEMVEEMDGSNTE